jgi:hypothetical protein
MCLLKVDNYFNRIHHYKSQMRGVYLHLYCALYPIISS